MTALPTFQSTAAQDAADIAAMTEAELKAAIRVLSWHGLKVTDAVRQARDERAIALATARLADEFGITVVAA